MKRCTTLVIIILNVHKQAIFKVHLNGKTYKNAVLATHSLI